MNEKQMRYVVKCQSIKKALLAKVILFVALFFVGLSAQAGNTDMKRVTLKVENESIKSIFQKI